VAAALIAMTVRGHRVPTVAVSAVV
jgi:hypothetical protein